MNTLTRFTAGIVSGLMIALVPAGLVWSADEAASVAQVYLEFDPATGEFKAVPATPENSPDGTSMPHTGTRQHSGTTPSDAAQTTAEPEARIAMTPADDAAGTAQGITSAVVTGIVVLVLTGVVALVIRKKLV